MTSRAVLRAPTSDHNAALSDPSGSDVWNTCSVMSTSVSRHTQVPPVSMLRCGRRRSRASRSFVSTRHARRISSTKSMPASSGGVRTISAQMCIGFDSSSAVIIKAPIASIAAIRLAPLPWSRSVSGPDRDVYRSFAWAAVNEMSAAPSTCPRLSLDDTRTAPHRTVELCKRRPARALPTPDIAGRSGR